jgi:hypothetical protein
MHAPPSAWPQHHTLLDAPALKAVLSLMLSKGIPSDLYQPAQYDVFVAEYCNRFSFMFIASLFKVLYGNNNIYILSWKKCYV